MHTNIAAGGIIRSNARYSARSSDAAALSRSYRDVIIIYYSLSINAWIVARRWGSIVFSDTRPFQFMKTSCSTKSAQTKRRQVFDLTALFGCGGRI
jgi:hypothetical protein